MNYYYLEHSTDLKQIGHYPQVSDAIYNDVNDPLFIGNQIFKKTKIGTWVPKGILNKKAKPIDYLATGTMGFTLNMLVSAKMADIFISNKYTGFESFETTIIVGKQALPYYLFHPFEFGFSYLDMELSSFERINRESDQSEPIRFKSSAEFQSALDNQNIENDRRYRYRIKDVALSNDVDVDLFSLRGVNGRSGFIASQNLKDDLEEARVTGVLFVQV